MKVDLPTTPIRIPGFLFSGVSCGIKESGKPDLAVIYAERPAAVAAAFTSNRVQAAPVQIAREHTRAGRLRAIVVNSGNANAFTGAAGIKAARAMCRLVGQHLRVPAAQVLPCSTGRIGVPLPMDRVESGIRAACQSLSPDGFHSALAAIMTTDAFPKFSTRTVPLAGQEVVVAGMAKGAGMIAPRLSLAPHATLLAFLFTNAPLTRDALRALLRAVLPESFNAAVVDGDTSTNDTVAFLASGVASLAPIAPRSPAFGAIAQAATEVARELARMVVRDGEGATRIIDVVVRGAQTKADAERAADAIARSPLCKAAFYGGDPYMGRVVCALGYSGARFDPSRIRIYLDDLLVVDRGVELVSQVEGQAQAIAARSEFRLTVDLRAGSAQALRFCSDLTEEYVRFNSAYRT
ncbi:MAG: bifunctional glutamate N-acetyltransferase/amino-acid acetyltransferase ArgJ [Candidatus Binatia bacterium]|nr:bifunctional glutamate N-acetyltransferase/amino-acid acetyltransferase ArgJ [Candidatus Binatia bacterium]